MHNQSSSIQDLGMGWKSVSPPNTLSVVLSATGLLVTASTDLRFLKEGYIA